MDRITTEKRDGSDELAGSCEAISPGPPGSNRVIPFPAPPPSPGREGAGVSPASASSFIPLGDAVHAVVLRLKGDFPRVRVMAGAPWEEEQARRPLNQPPEGDEPR